MPPQPRHECSSEVRRTRHPQPGNACIWQSRQIRRAEREQGASRPKGEQPDSASQSPRPLRGGGGRETRSINSPTSAGAFPAGQWRGTIMTGFRIKRCAHLQRRRCDERGKRRTWDEGLAFGLTVGNCGRSARSVKRHPGNCYGKKNNQKKKNPRVQPSLIRAWGIRFFWSFCLFYPDFFVVVESSQKVPECRADLRYLLKKRREWKCLFLSAEYLKSRERTVILDGCRDNQIPKVLRHCLTTRLAD